MASSEGRVADDSDSEDDEEDLKVSANNVVRLSLYHLVSDSTRCQHFCIYLT